MLKKSNPKEEPVWQKKAPAIPVRDNMKTTYVHMSSMYGDRLPKLRTIERPELSDKARHFKSTSESSMTRHVNIMYKEHQHMMRKLAHYQDSAFQVMCRVHRDKRNAQRDVCLRRQRELRGQMRSHRIRALMLNAATKFRDNVVKKKKQRDQALKKGTEKTTDSKSSDKDTTNRETDVLIQPDELSHNNKMTFDASKRGKVTVYGNKEHMGMDQDALGDGQSTTGYPSFRDRKGSLSGVDKSITPAGRSSENRESRGTSEHVSSHTRDEIIVQRRSSIVLEVTKLESKSVTRRKESVRRVSRSVTVTSESEAGKDVAITDPDANTERSDVPVAIESRGNSAKNNQVTVDDPSKRMRDDGLDHGWFTYGNPIIDNTTARGGSWTEETDTRDTSEDIHPGRRVSRSLSPVRRKRGVARLPDGYLREDMNTTAREETAGIRSRTSSMNSAQRRDRLSASSNRTRMSEELIDRGSRSSVERSTPKLIPVATTDLNSRRMGSGKTLQTYNKGGEDDAYPKRKDTLSSITSQRYHAKLSAVSMEQRPSQSPEHISIARSKLLPVNTLKQKQKNTYVSANMMWVLKQEAKSRKRWQTLMSDDDTILKYHRDEQGKLVGKLANRRTEFVPPSRQEQYRQQKLLVGEQVLKWEYRERIQDFYKNMFHLAESTRPVVVELPPPKDPTSEKLPPIPNPQVNKIRTIFDEYRQRDLVVAGDPNSYDAMKGVAYLRGKDKSSERIQL